MSTPASAIKPLHALRVLQPAGGALLEQLGLYRRLLAVEWEQERSRLLQLLLAALQAFACLLCLLLATGAVVVAVCWATRYRIPALVAVPGAYALGAALGWRRLRSVAARGKQSFVATRTELAADLELLRSRL
jgi:uncharacterized membrane protein YqjE